MQPRTIPDNEPVAATVHGGRTESRVENGSRWTRPAVEALFELPFNDLLHRAQTVHRLHFDANAVQLSTLLSIKTGGCPEDCAFCPHSARFRPGAGIKVCCGGSVRQGEPRAQRAGLAAELAGLDPPPESVPINDLVQVEGTPLNGLPKLDWSEFVRTIACARIAMPQSFVRLSAGRAEMPEAG